tara:strand:- start:1911 stop:2174 length:264 start_codon:yes stop_codon:yes gene_type:complete
MKAPNEHADEVDIELMMNASAYYVAKHYNLSMGQVWKMNQQEFQESLAFASAADRLKAEEMEKMKKDSKGKMRVAGTDAAQPMPFSE